MIRPEKKPVKCIFRAIMQRSGTWVAVIISNISQTTQNNDKPSRSKKKSVFPRMIRTIDSEKTVKSICAAAVCAVFGALLLLFYFYQKAPHCKPTYVE